MVDVDAALDAAGLNNQAVRAYVREWAEILQPERVEVVSAADDQRLIAEGLEAGEILPAGEGRYYSRSYFKDTARSEERTIVATNDEKDRGVYNNWRPASEMKEIQIERMRGAYKGKTMYVIPYLMSPPGSSAGALRGRCRTHRQPHRRDAHDPDGTRRRRPDREPCRPRDVRPRRARHRRPGEPRPGHP
ncbi:MAG: hypothetical protein V9G04_18355 [Nocardioides sp.]